MKYFEDLEKSAIDRNIPIMQREGLEFMINVFKENDCHCCLEIGSAIGYSAMMLVSNIDNFKVETIELNDERYFEAINNIKDNNLHFFENMSLAEDALFNLNYLTASNNDFIILNKPLYHYIKRENESLDQKYRHQPQP